MAAACFLSEDQFLCSICLDVFSDPVSTPCGHNFCKNCISHHWDTTDQYLCPMCKTVFNTRPELKINTLLAEMVVHFRQRSQEEPISSSSEQQAVKPGDVPCDVCTEPKLPALKCCLVCMASYCNTHLQPHLTLSGLKRHHLMDPVENLADRMCMKHDKPLELFCQTDCTCVCMFCTVLEHKTHDVVPLKDQYELKKTELRNTEAEIQQMIQERRLKIQEIQQSVDLSKKSADRQTAEVAEVFTSLVELVQKNLKQRQEEIQELHRSTEKRAEDFIQELEQELCELKNRSTKVETLSQSEDHLHFVQTLTSMEAAPPMKLWKQVSVRPPSYEGTMVRAVSQLDEELSKAMKDLFQNELQRVQKFSVDVSLDPDTAHPELTLSADEKLVRYSNRRETLPKKPQRFSKVPVVLGKQSFSSGRFYFEVQVKGSTWWGLGVVRESINRKGEITRRPSDGHWTIMKEDGDVCADLDDEDLCLSLKSVPQKVGVFVDYEEGLVYFYDVDSAVLIYSFRGCCFNDKLLPFFMLWYDPDNQNCSLIITPVVPSSNSPDSD